MLLLMQNPCVKVVLQVTKLTVFYYFSTFKDGKKACHEVYRRWATLLKVWLKPKQKH